MVASEDPATSLPDEEIGLVDLAIILAKRKWLLVGMPLFIGMVTAVVSFLMPEIYTATTKILPPQQAQTSTAAILGQLGGFAGGAAASLGLRNPADLYVGMLRSRTLADQLIEKFKLREVYRVQRQVDARNALEGSTRVSAGKEGFVTIEFDDSDPERAAAIANAYVDELTRLTGTFAVTEASQRRLFFERQLAQAKEDLLKAEMAAGSSIQSSGVSMVDAQGRSVIEVASQLRARVSAKEVELAAMKGFASDQNPDLLRVQQELSALRGQLARMEGGAERAESARRGVKESSLKTVSLLRNVKYHEFLFELLAKQYEAARMDEAKEAPLIQILDRAVTPEQRTRPKRRLMVTIAVLAGLVLTVGLIFVLEIVERARTDDKRQNKLGILIACIAGRPIV